MKNTIETIVTFVFVVAVAVVTMIADRHNIHLKQGATNDHTQLVG